jgi:hypothetical protein
MFDATYSDCLGNVSTTVYTQIPANYSFGETTYTQSSYDLCPYDSQCNPVSTTVNGVSSITPAGYTECIVPTPTPTATATPTPTSATTYNCNNGVCEIVTDGSGLYTTLEDCQANCQQTIYYCKENEFSPCTAQVGPCTGTQIVCTEFEVPN